MTESAARSRRWWKYLLIVTGGALALLLGTVWYLTTDSFQSYVKRRVVAELERITGGHAQVGSFHIVPFHMQVEVRDISIRGTEGPDEVPLAHADHLVAHVKVISVLGTEFGFHSVSLEHPVVHITVAADGSTNIPALKRIPVAPGRSPLEPLFGLSIDHLYVHDGELTWQDQKIPLNFSLGDTNLQMNYSYLRGRYEGELKLGKVDTVFDGYRPFSWMTTARFDLGRTFADVGSLEWTSGRSRLQATGRISDFRNPRVETNYLAHFDLGEMASIARRHDLREGAAEFKGSGQWSFEGNFGTSGAVDLRDVGWQDDQIVVRKANGTSGYSVTDQQFKLTKFESKLLGGSFSGDAQIDNWLHGEPLPPAGKPLRKRTDNLPIITAVRPTKKGVKTPGVQTGVARIRVRDISAWEMAAALDVPKHRLHGFHPAGSVAGTVDANWKGSPSAAEIAFALDVNPAARRAPGELPVTGHIAGKYRSLSDELELSRFDLSTPASRIQATGVLSAASTLHLSVSSSNLDEWRPLVMALGGPAALPFRVNGNASFNGVAEGKLFEPTIAGTLTAQDFDFTVPATSRTPEQPVHWDSLAASIQLSSREIVLRGGTLRRGETNADFDVTAYLQNWEFGTNSSYTARVNLHNVDVAATAALAGFDYPVTGRADVSAQMGGTRGRPELQGHIHAANASAYGEVIEKFDADVSMANGQTALNNIQLTHQDSAITGSAGYTPDTKGFKLDLVGTNFNLANIRQIQIHVDPLRIEGRFDFTLKGAGTLNAPAINAGVHIRDLTLDDETAGELYLEAVSQGETLHVTGHSQLKQGALTLDGSVQMRGDYPARIAAHTDHVDLDALWRAYLGEGLTGHSAVGGSLVMNGPLRYPRKWTLDGEADDLFLEVEYAKLHNEGPVRFTFAQQIAHIEPSHFVGDGTDVTGDGTIGFAGARDLNLSADGLLDLKMLGSLDKNLTAAGQITVHMKLTGTIDEPHPHGTVQIKAGTASYAGMPSGLSDLNGSMTFGRNGVHIEALTARTGGGTLDFKGDATIFNQQLSFNLTAIGKDVRLRYPPGVSSTANAELHWIGTRRDSTVSGDVLVNKLAVTPGFDFGSYLQRSRQTAGIAPANSPLYNVKLNVAVRTAPELQMKTTVARLSGDADLRLRGSIAQPSVLGRADILEGDATFNGIKFRLERGDITFANPVAIEPQVNLQATTHVRNYDLDVTVTGTPERLNVNYRSEPPLPKSDIIALLALGRTSEESEQLQQQSGQTLFTDEATAMIINQAINSTVSSRLQKLFGASRIKIDPQGMTTETNPTARGPQVTIEQEVVNNVSLTYSTNVSQSAEQIIEGEYYINRNISIVGIRDWNGVVSFDVRVRRRKK